jgi:hypothetical protein
MNVLMRSPREHSVPRPTRLATWIVAPVAALLVLAGASPALAGTPSVTPATSIQWLASGSPLTQSLPVEWTGKLKFQDEKLVINCESTGTGTVAPGGLGEMTKWTFTNCAQVEGCGYEEKPTLEALGLPWHTELTGSAENIIDSGSGSNPRFKFKCISSGEKVNEECELEAKPVAALTNTKTGVTEAIGNQKGSCLLRTKRVELVESSLAIKLTNGRVLQFS